MSENDKIEQANKKIAQEAESILNSDKPDLEDIKFLSLNYDQGTNRQIGKGVNPEVIEEIKRRYERNKRYKGYGDDMPEQTSSLSTVAKFTFQRLKTDLMQGHFKDAVIHTASGIGMLFHIGQKYTTQNDKVHNDHTL